MKHLFVSFISFVLLLMFSDPVYACTSFAVYADQVFYGMNFDFVNLPIKFLISVNGDIRTFHLAFERVMGDMGFFVNTAGMNSNGVFSSCQELHPGRTTPPEKTEANMFTFELYDAVGACRSAKEIKQMGQKSPLVDLPGITLHSLFADTTGEAFVAEAGDPDTIFTEKKDSFMVMTNFSTHTMAGKNYTEARGTGADRYIICHDFLREHASYFSVDKAFELLSLCRNQDPQYPTLCSLVCDPQTGNVYIVLDRDFSKILKLSIIDGCIETFKGYETNSLLPLPDGPEGIGTAELKAQFN